MKVFALPLLPLFAFCQGTIPSIQTKGACSPVVKGSGNTINIKTCGMTDQQVQEWRVSFRQILDKQIDPKVLVALLDDIKGGLIRVENGVLRIESKIAERRLSDQQKNTLVEQLNPLPAPTVSFLVFNSSPEVLDFVSDVQDVLLRLGWITTKVAPTVAFDPSSARGMGVVVRSQMEHPRASDLLIMTLREMGFQVEGATNPSLGTNEVRLVFSAK